MAGCIVAARPDLVERELACRVPRIALRQECYAQEGEDLLLARMFGDKRDGFYVDVGAHHPIRFSNTYLLYSRGWRGINIDASPGSIEEFKRLRPDDVNIECLIACTKEPRTFYLFSEPALNTGSAELAKARDEEDSIYKKVGKTVLQPRTLASLLGEHVAEGRTIDLLNVDVEGLDLEVLHSNDWNRFRPKVVLVEVFWNSDSWRNRDDISDYMIEKGYRLRARFYNTALFQMAD